MQNFKTVTLTLLGETAHFGFCPPQIVFFRGLGGGPQNIFFIGIFIFLWLRSPCKNLKSYDTPLCHFSNGGNNNNNKKKEKNTKNSGQPSAQRRSDQNVIFVAFFLTKLFDLVPWLFRIYCTAVNKESEDIRISEVRQTVQLLQPFLWRWG